MSYFNVDVVRIFFFAVFSKMLSVWDASLCTSADYIFLKDEHGNQGIFLELCAREKVKIPCFS